MSKVKKIATLTFGQGINILINFLFMPYMARVLSYDDYGSYGQVLLIVSFTSSILSFGLSQIIFVYLNSDKSQETVFSTNLFATTLLGMIGFLFLYLSATFFGNFLNNPSLSKLIPIFGISLIFTLPNQSINSLLIFLNKVKISAFLNVSVNLFKILLVVGAIQIYQSVYLAFVGILISQLVQFLVGIYLTKKSITLKIDQSLFWEQLTQGFPLGLTGILGSGILYVDGIMVSKILGVQEYAIYRNGAIEVPFISTIYTSIAVIIMPEVTKLFSENKLKEIVELKKKVIMNTMMLTYPILVFLLFNAKDLIVLYLGLKYEASAIIFGVYNLTLLYRVNDYSDILIAANKSRYILYCYFFAFILNLTLNYFFIHLFGTVGAAVSTVLSIFILAFLQLNKTLLIIKSNLKNLIEIKSIIHLICISLIISILLNWLFNLIHTDYVKIILFTISYFSIVYYYLIKVKLFHFDLLSRILKRK